MPRDEIRAILKWVLVIESLVLVGWFFAEKGGIRVAYYLPDPVVTVYLWRTFKNKNYALLTIVCNLIATTVLVFNPAAHRAWSYVGIASVLMAVLFGNSDGGDWGDKFEAFVKNLFKPKAKPVAARSGV